MELWLDEECWGGYANAQIAATETSEHATSFGQADFGSNLWAPDDLAQWQQVD